jgi:hypothetical protein
MSVVANKNGEFFQPHTYEREDEFESDVVAMAEQVFGPATIYVDVKRQVTGSGIVTIPDGYLVDITQPESPKLFVIENEIVKHDAFRHIGVQMLKFVTSFDEGQLQVRTFLMDEIGKRADQLARLKEGCALSEIRNIDAYLDQAVYSPFRGLVVIDEARPQLHHVLEKINANISVLEFRTFISESGERLHEFDTLYDEYEETIPEQSASERRGSQADWRRRRQARLAAADTIVVPAREEGFRDVFLGEDRWYKIRIGAAMKERIRYIAAYQVAPISAVTHIAEVQDIRPSEDTGKYVVNFKESAKEITPVTLNDPNQSPQGPVYVERERLIKSACLEDALHSD